MMQKLDKPLMMRIFIDFIIAAGDTVYALRLSLILFIYFVPNVFPLFHYPQTAFATVWALYLLASNANLQQSVRQDVLDSNTLECGAVKGVVRETLRLYPIAPFIGRFVEHESVFGAYALPKDVSDV